MKTPGPPRIPIWSKPPGHKVPVIQKKRRLVTRPSVIVSGLVVIAAIVGGFEYFVGFAYAAFYLWAGLASAPTWVWFLSALTVCFLAIWLLPRWQVSGSRGLADENRFDRENEARKTIAQLLGGLFLFVGFYASYQTLLNSREQQLTDRLTRSVDQLGATAVDGTPKIEIRLGGIYGLERIAHDSDKDNWPILEILTAYVTRNSPRIEEVDPKIKRRPLTRGSPRSDIAAILTVLARREFDCDNQIRFFGLSRTDLQGVVLASGNLCEIDFSDSLLQRANAANADLRLARFTQSDLTEANLASANCSGAHFEHAVLKKGNLLGAKLLYAIAPDADFSGTMLAQADATDSIFMRTDLRNANLLNTKFRKSNLSSADLSGDSLVLTDLTDANLEATNLDGADLSAATGITQSQIDSAIGNEQTKLPAGISRPSKWQHNSIPGPPR